MIPHPTHRLRKKKKSCGRSENRVSSSAERTRSSKVLRNEVRPFFLSEEFNVISKT